MTDRASFLAAVRATHRGADPGLPTVDRAPDAPTELVSGEDALDRLQAEAEAVATVVRRVRRIDVGTAVAEALRGEGARRVALADDLGPCAEAVRAAWPDAVAYADVAGDRAVAAALDATVTGCQAAVAATGSIVTTGRAGRAAALIAPVHVCVVRRDQVVPGLHALLTGTALDGVGSMFALQSGPSRSADIEKTLILGVHGPGRVHLILVED